MIKLLVQLDMPPQVPTERKQLPIRKTSIEDEVRHALDCIDSGHASGVEWIMVNKLYRALAKYKTPRAENLRKLIEPVLAKYGYHFGD